ncbi:toll/interleukin-1 receptor domain-containing protein [Rhizobium leguminosarum]|uniref:toll/interleukin-1 receptor domain-containing protein n=1 Tax=Rhizobium leguminosarum TaxID=384 RepID=UPI001C970202|nr:toll/interleukin-1 receptor domain-containing protein [Rhizobium leguminosarum]MBY5533622.1 toll/interleukin-1 receptor domain-containing protein [Rhizobium leguminosarum]
MADFFISYNATDRTWAEWIAYVIEDAGYTVLIQEWDFRPGMNFVLKMQEAAASDRTVLVLSPDYLRSEFAAPEWAAAFRDDPQGMKQKLLPVIVRECNPPGLLAPIVNVRLYDIDERSAQEALLGGLSRGRAKPSSPPQFPGSHQPEHKPFPGGNGASGQTGNRRSLTPQLRAKPTDRDKRLFSKSGFESIRMLFERNANDAMGDEPRVQIDIDIRTSADFRAELFVDGTRKNACRVWIGGLSGDNGIAYSQGQHFSNDSYNEMLSIQCDTELYFKALMGSSFGPTGLSVDITKMSGEQAGQYLWERFVEVLRY